MSDNLAKIEAATLSDGRVELLALQSEPVIPQPQIMSCWTTALEPPATASWTPWAPFDHQLPGSVHPHDVAAAPLVNKGLVAFAIGSDGLVYWSAKITPDSDAPWTPWTTGSFPQLQSLAQYPVNITACQLSDGRIVLWAIVQQNGQLFYCYQDTPTPDSGWDGWYAFTPPLESVYELSAIRRIDGAVQLWATDSNGGIRSCSQVNASDLKDWTPWSTWPGQGQKVMASPLSDGRILLFSYNVAAKVISLQWQQTTSPNSPWSEWVQLGELPATPYYGVGSILDGHTTVWFVGSDGNVFTTWKTTSDPNSPWMTFPFGSFRPGD